jgi:TRAP-type C4-dicarboxylate transport system permease small subunit
MNVGLLVAQLPDKLKPASRVLVELLMGLIAVFMAWYGTGLVEATWGNTIADFPGLSTGVTYLPIPIGGVILLLFVIERLTLGAPQGLGGDAHSTAAFD